MAVLEICKYPNPILKKKLSLVTNFNSNLKKIVQDMIETMHAYNGIGLAANQVGIDARIVVIDIKNEKNCPLALINPEITYFSKEKSRVEEGCLSFPGYFEKVYRSKTVKVTYFDLNGKKQEIVAEGLFSQAIQHEVDHINGITFVTRMAILKKIKFFLNYHLRKIKF